MAAATPLKPHAAAPDAEGYYTHARPEMLALVPATVKRVLDVGCGEGIFGGAIRERGAEVWGIELSPEAEPAASRRLDRVLIGDAAERVRDLPDASFDCVVCNDVLEHLVDPYSLLDDLRRVMTPDAVLVTSIPNVRWLPNLWNLLVKKDWTYQDDGILDRTHVRFFTKGTMRAMLEDAGFEVLHVEGINPMAGWKPPVFNALTLGAMRDTRWQQFAWVARPVR